jgi:acetyl esterase
LSEDAPSMFSPDLATPAASGSSSRWTQLRERWRRDLGAALVDGFFSGTARAGKMIPLSDPRLHNVEVDHDIPYRDTADAAHLLDLYRPKGATEPLPTVLYLHGGGFRILSKDSHWIFGLVYARRGYLVANASYRLSPRHKFPGAHEDAAAAYRWVVENIAGHGGDPSQIILAGESAGANLAASLAIATSYRRPEPWAASLFGLPQPKAVIAGCGLLQVSSPERFARPGRVGRFLQDRMDEVTEAYLDGTRATAACAMADPLCLLETGGAPQRPLPPFFAFCGTWDMLIHDTRRLGTALERLKVPHEIRYYPRGVHGFHAFVFDPNARQCWRDTFAFLGRTLPRVPRPVTSLFLR